MYIKLRLRKLISSLLDVFKWMSYLLFDLHVTTCPRFYTRAPVFMTKEQKTLNFVISFQSPFFYTP